MYCVLGKLNQEEGKKNSMGNLVRFDASIGYKRNDNN
jgi:hypothetical protein